MLSEKGRLQLRKTVISGKIILTKALKQLRLNENVLSWKRFLVLWASVLLICRNKETYCIRLKFSAYE